SGYEVKLNGGQTARLIEHRRHRDVLVGKHEKALAIAATDKPADQKPDGEPAKPQAEKPQEPEKEAAPAETEKPADHPSTDNAEAKEGESGPFVDVQLQKAVDYLSSELAKAQ
ncbi:MAG TPA: hypothetical protein VFW87_05860, partial [Pirellulales bacterium]|nr:hypothetical protein [Pirellulales bacterium]